MNYTIAQSKLNGVLKIPPSKSVGHRAIICACLCGEKCLVDNVAFNDDIIATIGAMRALGFDIVGYGDSVVVNIQKPCEPNDALTIDCNESGSTLRFVIPIALQRVSQKITFVGRGKLGSRPLNAFFDIFDRQGIEWKNNSPQRLDKHLDVEVCGHLEGGHFDIGGDVSSQFLTGLLFALPLCKRDSDIVITSPLQSVGYVDLTLKALKDFGINIEKDGNSKFWISGNQKYVAPSHYSVEGDFSQAAFFAVANYLGSNVEMRGLCDESLQGDKIIFELLKQLDERNCNCKMKKTEVENNESCKTNKLKVENNEGCKIEKTEVENNESCKTFVVDGKDCPDIIPIFSLACALTKGVTKIVDIGRLRVKECDRIMAICKGLGLLGAHIVEGKDFVEITGVDSLEGGVSVDSFGDHRIAMTMAIAALVCKKPITIVGAECVKKSYPNFFEDYASLGGKIV